MKTSELLPAETLRVIADIAREAVGNFRRGKRIRLLTENTKLSKVPGVSGRGWLLRGLAMAPADVGGHEACYWRSNGCTKACNGLFSGGNNMPGTRRAMIERKILFFERRDDFKGQLVDELTQFQRLADRQNMRAAVRLNVSTDIVWERIFRELFGLFPRINFYDYTKASVRHRPELPANYSLSHSVSERSTYADIVAAIAAGRNIVAAFNSGYVWGKYLNAKGYLPRHLKIIDRSGREPTIVIDCRNGDRHDLRLPVADGHGNCVALRGKGGRKLVAQAVADGFIVDFPEGRILRGRDPRARGEAILVC
jgi:hypothetical protein